MGKCACINSCPRYLGDTSNDLWRTINSWCDTIKANKLTINNTRFIIVTTATVKKDSAASYLAESHNRDWQKAHKILLAIAEGKGRKTNIPYYQTFLGLDAAEQENLISHIYICDTSPSITDIRTSIMPYIRVGTLQPFEERVYDKVVGWWIRHIIQCLISVEPVFISYRQLQQALFDIGSEYKADSLPIDVNPYYQPTEKEIEALSSRDRVFIKQLNLIALSNESLKRCVRDYYNAYRQRSQWVRESLLFIDDLTKYENALIDEWERLYYVMKEHIDDCGDTVTDTQKCIHGKALLRKVEELDLPIRKNVTQPFIMRGTFHELANQLKIGWHIDYMNRLAHLLRG